MERPPRWTPLKEYPMRWKMRSSYLFPSLFSLPLSPLPCLANLNSNHRPAPPFVPSSGRSKDPRKPKLRKKGRKKEKSGERGRGRAFQRVFRMKSRPNEVRKLPNGEASSLLLVGSKWRGKKCRLAVAFVAGRMTDSWRTPRCKSCCTVVVAHE